MNYIKCTNDLAINSELTEHFISKIKCSVHELDSDHVPMLSHPKELASLLESIAK